MGCDFILWIKKRTTLSSFVFHRGKEVTKVGYSYCIKSSSNDQKDRISLGQHNRGFSEPVSIRGYRCMYSASLFIVIKRLRVRADAEDKANKMALSG